VTKFATTPTSELRDEEKRDEERCYGRTLDMLNTKLLDETRREDPRSERSSEDGRELGIQSSDSHVLELEVGLEDSVWRSP